jgi:hypothetical protein
LTEWGFSFTGDEEVFSQYLKTMNTPAGKMRTFSAVAKEIPA